MTTLAELLGAHSGLTTLRVERWVARGLLRPTPDGSESWSFEQVDIARVRLLAELGDDLGLDDDTIEAVIGLIDQVHTLRSQIDLPPGSYLVRLVVRDAEGIAMAMRNGAVEIPF